MNIYGWIFYEFFQDLKCLIDTNWTTVRLINFSIQTKLCKWPNIFWTTMHHKLKIVTLVITYFSCTIITMPGIFLGYNIVFMKN